MRYLFSLLIFFQISCSAEDDPVYTGRQIEYELHQAGPDYDYHGKILFKELQTGSLEIHIELVGEKASPENYFPAHLHYGGFEHHHAPMAAMLNPVDSRSLRSVTVLDLLSNGEEFKFEDIHTFDGHVKVHLAEDGPDYHVILVAGNIGGNVRTD